MRGRAPAAAQRPAAGEHPPGVRQAAGRPLREPAEQAGAEALILKGRACLQKKNYAAARTALEQAEQLGEPRYDLLELCCRELKDFENAYAYACRAREKENIRGAD